MKQLTNTELKKVGENLNYYKYGIYVTNTNNPNPNGQIVAKVTTLGDANIMVSALLKAVKSSPLSYSVKKIA